jgi:hypothetical protein
MRRLHKRDFCNIVNLACCMAAWLTCQPSTSQGATHVSTQSYASPAEETLWINANGLRLKSNLYRNLRLNKQ